MLDLIRMDLWRMRHKRSFMVCLILAFVFALIQTPLTELMQMLLGAREAGQEMAVSDVLKDAYPDFGAMLLFLAVCGFYYADHEGGFIKNIAGQTPKRAYVICSKFYATAFPVVAFALVGIAGSLLGALPFRRIVFDTGIPAALLNLLLKLLLAYAVCTVLLLIVSVLHLKPLGTTLAVFFGTGLIGLLYSAISAGFNKLFKSHFSLSDYMPDQLLVQTDPDLAIALASAAVTAALFLFLSVRIFNRRDVR